MKIGVIIKEPNKAPRHVNIENSLQNLQRTVGGYIEYVPVTSDLAIICNEEGLIYGLEPNVNVLGHQFVGTIIFVGVDGEDLADIPLTFAEMKRMFPQLWEVAE